MTRVAAGKAPRSIEREALADLLIDRAKWTYDRLSSGRRFGVELHEETITQDLLLDISTMLPAIGVRTFTRWEEARNGADWQWEWWLSGQGWFGLRIQAKRLKELRSGRLGYDLRYRVQHDWRRERQVDLLIEEASAHGLQAVYVLYNGPDLDIGQFTWGCCRLQAGPEPFGVSVLPATVARDLVDARTVDLASVGARSRPWSCLVTCDDSSGCYRFRAPMRPPPGIGTGGLAWWAAQSYLRIVAQTRSGLEQEPPGNQDVLVGLHREAPPYVYSLLNGTVPDTVLPPRVRALTIFQSR